MPTSRPSGMRAFMIVWAGQVVSLLGSAMTQFALTIWAYQLTGSATALALVALFSFGPSVLFSPIAGALVDRWNRKLVMMLSDLAAGISTVVIFLLYLTGALQIWHLYAAGVLAGVFGAFQWPAYSAAISTMLPKTQYARANALLSVADSASGIIAPILASAALVLVGIQGVLIFDIVTFVVAVAALLFVVIPQPAQTAEGAASKGSLWQEMLYGLRYIVGRPSLLGLQLTFLATNLAGAFALGLRAPMVLARTGSDEAALAAVQSAAALGALLGGVILSAWGGRKRHVPLLLTAMIIGTLIDGTVMGLGQTLIVWTMAAFASSFTFPFVNGANQAIWQAKVAPDVQGRVFATRRMIAQITIPVGLVLAGPLADRLFEPAMQPGGAFAPLFGGLVGVGPGAGMGLILVITGLLGAVVPVLGFFIPAVRDAETRLPDHDSALAPTAPSSASAARTT